MYLSICEIIFRICAVVSVTSSTFSFCLVNSTYLHRQIKDNFLINLIVSIHSHTLTIVMISAVVLEEAQSARDHLLKALKELLLGDELAAEYLICHLIACV